MNSLELPQILYQPFAATGDKNTILNSPSTEDPQRANLQTGFPTITQIPIANGGIPPERMDFNGLGYLLSSFYFFTQCGGIYTFNQDVSNAIGGYPLGAVLYYTDSDGTTYKVRSLLENNTYNFVTTPSYIDDEHWAYVSSTPITQDTSASSASNVFSTAAAQSLINSKISNTLSAIYPIGSLYITTQNISSCPIAGLISGSRWSLVAQNRALWGGNGSNGNSTINAGLPNIKGNFQSQCLHFPYDTPYTKGALYAEGLGDSYKQNGGGTDGTNNVTIAFDASRSNNIYGASSTVQPPAYRVNVWRRTA
jgi:hypothetical protein